MADDLTDVKKVVLAYSGGLDTSVICAGCRIPTIVKSSPSPPISAKVRNWNPRAKKPNSWA